MTSAGLALAGTPLTVPPDAQVIASAMSEMLPPHLASTRTGWILALNAVPATPMPLLVNAATVPATCVPCQLEFEPTSWPHSPAVYQSPWSAGLESRPLPSRAAVASLTMWRCRCRDDGRAAQASLARMPASDPGSPTVAGTADRWASAQPAADGRLRRIRRGIGGELPHQRFGFDAVELAAGAHDVCADGEPANVFQPHALPWPAPMAAVSSERCSVAALAARRCHRILTANVTTPTVPVRLARPGRRGAPQRGDGKRMHTVRCTVYPWA